MGCFSICSTTVCWFLKCQPLVIPLLQLSELFSWKEAPRNGNILIQWTWHTRDVVRLRVACLVVCSSTRGNSSVGQMFKGKYLIRPQFLQTLICSSGQWLKPQVGCVSSWFLEGFIWQILCREKSCPACQWVLASTLRRRKWEQRETAKLWRGCFPAKHAKESQAWLNILEKELPPCFWPTRWEKWQPFGKKVAAGSRAWADSFNGKGGLPA